MDGAGRLAKKLRPQADLKAAAIGAAVLLREYLGSRRAARKPAKRPMIDRVPPPRVVAWIERNVPRRAGLTATVLLLLGVVGLVLPVLQGVLFLVGGLALIDLPIKGKAHRWLMRFALYRRISKKHDQLLARWRDWYAKRRTRDEGPADEADEED